MKCTWLLVLTVAGLVVSAGEPCQWDQYLGNPGRTAYTDCSVVDSPEVLWEITLDGEASMPFIVRDKVFVLSTPYYVFPGSLQHPLQEPNITVVDLMTGSLLQKIVPDVDFADVHPVGNTVLVYSVEELYKLDLASGSTSFVSKIPGEWSCVSDCYPLVLPDRIVYPAKPMVCLSRDDYSTLWDLKSTLGSFYPQNAKIWTIAASMNQLYIIFEEDNERKVMAVDAETGELIWVSDSLFIWRIAADGSTVFVGGDNLYALDAGTGEQLWMFELDFAVSNIVVGTTGVYLTDNQNYLYAVDKDTGELIWNNPWEEPPHWPTYIVGIGDTIICSNAMEMTCFFTKDGSRLWNVHFQDISDISLGNFCPAVADGIIVVVKRLLHKEGDISVLEPYRLMAFASDPDLFIKQGDKFLSESLKDQAINSYEKAAELYEKKGNMSRSQEVREHIRELESQPESIPPETTPPTTPESTASPPETTLPPTPPEFSMLISVSVVVILIGAMIGISIVYYLTRHKKTKNSQ